MRARAYIAALPSLLREQLIENAFRNYVADTLQYISMNTANFVGGKHPGERYHDMVYDLTHDLPYAEKEAMTEEEIIAKVRKGWGGGAQ